MISSSLVEINLNVRVEEGSRPTSMTILYTYIVLNSCVVILK